jgi:hypothetical protein
VLFHCPGCCWQHSCNLGCNLEGPAPTSTVYQHTKTLYITTASILCMLCCRFNAQGAPASITGFQDAIYKVLSTQALHISPVSNSLSAAAVSLHRPLPAALLVSKIRSTRCCPCKHFTTALRLNLVPLLLFHCTGLCRQHLWHSGCNLQGAVHTSTLQRY